MSVRRLICLLLLLRAAPSAAQDDWVFLGCPFSFATLNDESEALPLIVGTYQKLLGTLGSDLSSESLAEMIRSQDPFRIPDRERAELLALRRNLERFRAMLADGEWNSTAIKNSLVGVLKTRLEGVETQRQEREAGVQETRPDLSVPLSHSNRVAISPDGRFLLTSNMPTGVKPGVAWTLNIHQADLPGNREIAGGSGYLWGPFFTAAGNHVLFTNGEGQFRKVPFREGELDWSRAEWMGESDKDIGALGEVRSGKNPKLFYAADDTRVIWKFDLTKNTRVPLAQKAFLGAGAEILYWGVLPDSDRLYLVSTSGPKGPVRFDVVEAGASGTIKKVGYPYQHRTLEIPELHAGYEIRRLAIAENGKTVVIVNGHQAATAFPNGKKPVPLVPLADVKGTTKNTVVSAVVANPRADQLAVLYQRSDQTGDRYWVELLNAQTLELVKAFDVPNVTFNIQFTPDGKSLWAITNEDKVTRLNVVAR